MSLTIAGLIVAVLGRIAQSLGYNLNVSQESLVQAVTVFVQLAGLFIAWYGRYRKGDISLLGKRLTNTTIDSLPDAEIKP